MAEKKKKAQREVAGWKSTVEGTETVRATEFNDKPLLQFGPEDSRFPFQFGVGKAKALVAAMDELGDEEFCSLIRSFAG